MVAKDNIVNNHTADREGCIYAKSKRKMSNTHILSSLSRNENIGRQKQAVNHKFILLLETMAFEDSTINYPGTPN